MNWEEAETNLRTNILVNDRLDGFDHYKIVIEVPPYSNNQGDEGFKIKIGKTNHINVSLKMLKLIFEASVQNNRIYNRHIFEALFPVEINNKPCYVHTVGKLFVEAGIANQVNYRNYIIL